MDQAKKVVWKLKIREFRSLHTKSDPDIGISFDLFKAYSTTKTNNNAGALQTPLASHKTEEWNAPSILLKIMKDTPKKKKHAFNSP